MLATLVISVIAFLAGWLIFGIVFADYYTSATMDVAKPIVKLQPVMWAIAIANIAWCALLASVIQGTGDTTFVKGFFTGLRISFLVMLIFNLSVFGFWDIYPLHFLVTDIAVSTLFWGVMGGIAGAILGSAKKQA